LQVLDKEILLKKAKMIGVPIPNTFFIRKIEEIKFLSKKLSYPVVIKVRKESNLFQEKRYKIVCSEKEFSEEYLKMHYSIQKFPIIQEFVRGEGIGFHAILDSKQNPLAIFMHRRLREYPISGGPSTLCESVDNLLVKRYGLRLLKALKWSGLAMVEFRVDENGIPVIMEVNPRFWGSFPLAVVSGVNFPYILYLWAKGERFTPVLKYKIGVKLRFLFSDLKAAEEYLLTRPGKLSFLGRFLKDLTDRRIKEGNIVFDDLYPSVPFLLDYLRHLFKGPFALPKVDLRK